MTNSTQSPPHGHDDDHHAGPERLAQRLSESAQQVWLAGLGAFNRAQAEGSKLFDGLVKDGEAYERRNRAEHGDAGNLRDSVQSGLGQAREKGARTWEKVETAFEDQVQSVLRRLQVPSREDVAQLQAQVQVLRQRIGELEAKLVSARTVIPAAPHATTPTPPAGDAKPGL
jgi:poly(hydroxyalkanoate) granule-associated protein